MLLSYLGEWVVHARADVVVELFVRDVAQGKLAVHAVLLCGADYTSGDDDGDFADAGDVGVKPIFGDLLGQERGRKSFGGGVDHVLGDVDRLGENCAETNSREDVPNTKCQQMD